MNSSRVPFELPKEIPLFPLSKVILLPFGHVPLNVFEPRYINMVDDVLGLSNSRIIGVIQPRADHSGPIPDECELFDVGTAGRIVHFGDVGDGRYHVVLEGLSRFKLAGTPVLDPVQGYARVQADYTPFTQDLNVNDGDDADDAQEPDLALNREHIFELMQNYFISRGIEADWEAVSDAPFESLVSSLAMTCPFESQEKQALLQCTAHEERANMLISLFEMSIANSSAQSGTALKH